MILGIDEVGRGPWAGPLVVGAVVLGGANIDGLTDSKKLSKKRREELDIQIRSHAGGVGLGWVWPEEIDSIGLSASLVLATKRAVEQIKTSYHEIIIDGTVNFLKETTKGQYVTTMKKADLLVPAVSAASIVAKVARDNYMVQQSELYPAYGFDKHVGYGTLAHREAIATYGVTPMHRLSIAPLLKYAKKDTILQKPIRKGLSLAMSTKAIGDDGEEVAAKYLKDQGHRILDRNWKTKQSEIDIVTEKDDTIYFVEVKYRKNKQHGGGIAAITPKKLHHMRRAADLYVLIHTITDRNLQMLAVSVSGDPPQQIDDVLEIV